MRTSTHMEVLFSCLLAITLGILIIVSLLQYKQQSKSLQKDIENRSPFVTFCKMWSASSAGMSTPSAAATANPSLTFAFYHFYVLEDRPLIKYCRLSVVVTPVVSRTFFALITIQQMHLVKKISFVTKRSPTTLDPGVSNTSRRLVKTKQIRNIANIHPENGFLKDLRNDSPSVTHLRSVRVDMGLTARL